MTQSGHTINFHGVVFPFAVRFGAVLLKRITLYDIAFNKIAPHRTVEFFKI